MAARLPIYVANMRDNPQWLAMFALGRFLPVRQALWRLAHEGASLDCSGSMFGDGTVPGAVNALRAEGLFTGLRLPEPVCEAIRRFARTTPCFANLSRRVEFLPSAHGDAASRLGCPVLTGHYFDRVEACAAVAMVRGDPLLRGGGLSRPPGPRDQHAPMVELPGPQRERRGPEPRVAGEAALRS